jgi:PRTRC genetic system protein E
VRTLYSATEKQAKQSPKNDDEMNFFRQLAGMGNVDVTLRIMQKNGKLTMMVLPGSASSATMPLNFTGTPEELDAEFFTTIAPAANEVAGIVSNVDEVKEVVKKEPEKKASTPAKKTAAPAKKPTPAKQKPKSAGKTAKNMQEKNQRLKIQWIK